MQTIRIERIRLEKIYFGFEGRGWVFEDLTFEPPKNPLVWLKGAPGSGKSSLLKILAGLITPQSGRYLINDTDVLEMSFKEFLPYRFATGYSFDSGGLLSNRSLYENLLLPLVFHKTMDIDEASKRVLRWMEKFNLMSVKDQRPFSVTGSQRKSAVVLRTFIHYPQYVFLDDPMAGLKEDGRKAFAELFEECLNEHGLKQVLFSAERELPFIKITPKQCLLSSEKKPSLEAS